MKRFTQFISEGKAFCRATPCVSPFIDDSEPVCGEAIDRLAELEDKIESGQLVELPCKIGDTVFVLRNGAGSPLHIEEEKIISFDILQNTIMAHGKYGHAYSEVFLTKLEAEARLKELQE